MITATGNRAAGEKGSGSFPVAVCRGRWVDASTRNEPDPFRGFTLIEMLAVIVLIAIAVTVTAVSLHGRSRGELDAAAQGIAAGLRDTRTRAMATGKAQWFTLDIAPPHVHDAGARSPRAACAGDARCHDGADQRFQAGHRAHRLFPGRQFQRRPHHPERAAPCDARERGLADRRGDGDERSGAVNARQKGSGSFLRCFSWMPG